MAKPYYHAKNSVKRYGGIIEDYIKIHDFMDSTKAAFPDVRHRAILHSAFGCFVVETVFGHIIVNADGKEISTRQIAEDHCVEDVGFVPTLEQWVKNIPIEDWMLGKGQEYRMNID
jgi:hypothetical protein